MTEEEAEVLSEEAEAVLSEEAEVVEDLWVLQVFSLVSKSKFSLFLLFRAWNFYAPM